MAPDAHQRRDGRGYEGPAINTLLIAAGSFADVPQRTDTDWQRIEAAVRAVITAICSDP